MKCRYILLLALWILWQELMLTSGLAKNSWVFIGAYPSQATCLESAALKNSEMQQIPNKVLESGETFHRFRTKDGQEFAIAYHCVPDTVDPRPK